MYLLTSAQSIRLLCETRESVDEPFMYFFAEPVSEEEIQAIQDQATLETRETEALLAEQSPRSGSDARQATKLNSGVQWSADVEDCNVLDDTRDNDGQTVAEASAEHEPELSSLIEPGSVSLKVNDFEGLPDAESALEDQEADSLVNVQPPDTDLIESLEGAADASLRVRSEEDVADRSADEEAEVDEADESENDPTTKTTGATESTSASGANEKSTESPAPQKDLLAFRVRVRHKIGSEVVKRPHRLDSKSAPWQLRYHIEEYTKERQKWEKYRACQVRRKKILGRDREFAGNYIKQLEELSRKGKQRRTHEAQRQVDSKAVVVGVPSQPSSR
jgi:hypothetical protein